MPCPLPHQGNTAKRGRYHLLAGKSVLLKVSNTTAVKSCPFNNYLFENNISIEVNTHSLSIQASVRAERRKYRCSTHNLPYFGQ